jgi:hypothetical protein
MRTLKRDNVEALVAFFGQQFATIVFIRTLIIAIENYIAGFAAGTLEKLHDHTRLLKSANE